MMSRTPSFSQSFHRQIWFSPFLSVSDKHIQTSASMQLSMYMCCSCIVGSSQAHCSAAPVVHHGGGVGPVFRRGDLLESREAGVALEAELRHKLGARVHARVHAVPAIVVVVAVAPAGVRCINSPPAIQHPWSPRVRLLLCHYQDGMHLDTPHAHLCALH